MAYHLRLLEQQRLAFSADLDGPVEIGRQRADESPEYRLRPLEGETQRLVVAPLSETTVGRRQILVTPLANDQVELTNVSETLPMRVVGQTPVPPLGKEVYSLPLVISLNADRVVALDPIDDSRPLEGLTEVTNLPLQTGDLASAIKRAATIRFGTLEEMGVLESPSSAGQAGSRIKDIQQSEFLVVALQKVMDVFQTACTVEQLFKTAAEGAVSLLNLDTARVLSFCDGKWSEELTVPEQRHRSISAASSHVLRRLQSERRTFWDKEMASRAASASLLDVESVVAAPILSPTGEVIGALYGDRRRVINDRRESLSSLEARLMELLACGISSGLARQQQEEAARKMRLQFEQFFSPELAEELEQNPDLLLGRDAEVSILFCDIRGFSRITERVGTSRTFDWIVDVMGVLSDCVLRHSGVLVDYIGDELMAMWGAPRPQENHRELACRAAQEMVTRLPEINRRWYERLGEVMDLGIGINSGMVKVGNSGSLYKFKYSPLGNAVNLASRVQGATKHLGVRLIVTGETAQGLPSDIVTRPLCDVQVVNMDVPVRLLEILPPETSPNLIQGYTQALKLFENREFRSAAHYAGRLIEEFPGDGPSLVLLSRIVECLISGPPPLHPVWKLPGK